MRRTADRLRRCQLSSTVSVKRLTVGGNVDHIHRRDLYSAARPSRRNVFLPRDAAMVRNVAATLWQIMEVARGLKRHRSSAFLNSKLFEYNLAIKSAILTVIYRPKSYSLTQA